MQLAIPLFYVAAGITLFLGIQATFLAVSGYSRTLLGWFAGLSFAAGGYQLTSALYHLSSDVQTAVFFLHWQSATLVLCIFASVGFIGTYTQDRQTPLWLWLAAAMSVVLLLLDWTSEQSIRFTARVVSRPVQLPWGETVFELAGEVGLSGILLHLTGQVLMVWSFWRAMVMHRRDRRRSRFLLTYLVIQFGAVVFGVGIDLGYYHSIKLIGFGFISLVVLMAASIAIDLKQLMYQLGVQREALSHERSLSEMLKVDQERLSQVVAQSPSSIHLLDRDGRLTQKNLASRRLWKDSVEHGDMMFTKDPWNRLGVEALCREALHQGKVKHQLLEIDPLYLHNCDRRKWIDFTVFPITGSEGYNDGIAIISEDVSRQQYIEKSLKMVASGAPAGTGFFADICRQVGLLCSANFVYVAQFDQGTGGRSFTTLSFVVGGEPRDNFSSGVGGRHAETLLNGAICEVATGVRARFPEDEFVSFYNVDSFIGVPLKDDMGELLGFIAVLDSSPMDGLGDVRPILEIVANRVGSEVQRLDAEHRIRRMAYEDYVTRLPNRAMLHEHLGELIRRSQMTGLQAVAYFLDLDHFKTINEALGHDVGDDVLRRAAMRLSEVANERVFVARLGGDEFVLLEELDDDVELDAHVGVRAQSIINLLSQPLELGDRIVSLGTSVGVLCIPEHANNELDVLRRGDSALFKAKQEGRNRYEIYDPGMQKNVDERLEVERGLRLALDDGQLEIFYQPKVDNRGLCVGAEALIRWRHPTRGFIPPDIFIPVAEETGLIHLIGDWIIETIADHLVKWHREGLQAFGDVAINISAWQFARPDFIGKLLAAVQGSGLDVSRFSVEVTETAILRDITATRAKLAQLREFGMHVALDDFGTGYSSLAYLKDLPLDAFKIDRAFVDGLANTQTEALVQSMIAIGSHMGLDVVAEGVETHSQFEQLVRMGCEIFQGYLFARPMPEGEFFSWVRNNLGGAHEHSNSAG